MVSVVKLFYVLRSLHLFLENVDGYFISCKIWNCIKEMVPNAKKDAALACWPLAAMRSWWIVCGYHSPITKQKPTAFHWLVGLFDNYVNHLYILSASDGVQRTCVRKTELGTFFTDMIDQKTNDMTAECCPNWSTSILQLAAAVRRVIKLIIFPPSL